MKFADTISTFFITLTQQLINVLTSPENVKKYDVIIQNILDILTSTKNAEKYDVLLQNFINKLLSPENIEKYKMSYGQLQKTGAVNAPKAGKFDEETKKKIQDIGLPDVPLPQWSEPK